MDLTLDLKLLCAKAIESQGEYSGNLKKLLEILPKIPQDLLQRIQANVLCVGFPVFKSVQEGKDE